MRYRGRIEKLNKIIISDPSYGEDVGCRYERSNLNENEWKIEIAINDFEHKYEDGITVKGIDFYILMSKDRERCILNDDGSFRYLSKNRINETEIGVDTACISIGINEFADKIKDSIEEWQPEFALSTLTDGLFGKVKEGITNDNINFIWFNGFLDEDTGYTKENILEYLNEQMQIKEIHEVIEKDEMDCEM